MVNEGRLTARVMLTTAATVAVLAFGMNVIHCMALTDGMAMFQIACVGFSDGVWREMNRVLDGGFAAHTECVHEYYCRMSTASLINNAACQCFLDTRVVHVFSQYRHQHRLPACSRKGMRHNTFVRYLPLT